MWALHSKKGTQSSKCTRPSTNISQGKICESLGPCEESDFKIAKSIGPNYKPLFKFGDSIHIEFGSFVLHKFIPGPTN